MDYSILIARVESDNELKPENNLFQTGNDASVYVYIGIIDFL